MTLRFSKRLRLAIGGIAIVAMALSLGVAYLSSSPHTAKAAAHTGPFCTAHAALCTETTQPWDYQGQYIGHDEPSLLFYSNTPGSGNSNVYQLTLPKDPPTLPAQDGSGGTWNFQLHPAFWFGMAMCDNQSAPDPGAVCTPDSDSNIHASTDPKSKDYLGNTPGTAFMEMQFYPPGWDSFGCTQTQWCSALTIDSFSSNSNTGVLNNDACLAAAGEEYVNFAFITKSGTTANQGPADPLDQTAGTFTVGPDTLKYNPGDHLIVSMHDTVGGFVVQITDTTTGTTGSMTASAANQFGHPLYKPHASHCTDQSYTFHPMYATSGPTTRVLWAAHSYNVAYSDEIGHFEYCAEQSGGTCTSAGVSESNGKTDGDDVGCFTEPGGPSSSSPLLTGCSGTDVDFDSPDYFNNWPGTDPATDATLHAAPVVFTSPLFNGSQNYSKVAFETDLPRVELSCERHVFNPADPNPGFGCVNPAPNSTFYPFFNASTTGGQCAWYEGGPGTPHDTFNGVSSPAEYGNLQVQIYPAAGNTTQGIYETFHNTLGSNPCHA